jgi:hypothetical protein
MPHRAASTDEETILDQVIAGSDSPSLSDDQQAHIRERFTHYWANYDAL